MTLTKPQRLIWRCIWDSLGKCCLKARVLQLQLQSVAPRTVMIHVGFTTCFENALKNFTCLVHYQVKRVLVRHTNPMNLFLCKSHLFLIHPNMTRVNARVAPSCQPTRRRIVLPMYDGVESSPLVQLKTRVWYPGIPCCVSQACGPRGFM